MFANCSPIWMQKLEYCADPLEISVVDYAEYNVWHSKPLLIVNQVHKCRWLFGSQGYEFVEHEWNKWQKKTRRINSPAVLDDCCFHRLKRTVRMSSSGLKCFQHQTKSENYVCQKMRSLYWKRRLCHRSTSLTRSTQCRFPISDWIITSR